MTPLMCRVFGHRFIESKLVISGRSLEHWQCFRCGAEADPEGYSAAIKVIAQKAVEQSR